MFRAFKKESDGKKWWMKHTLTLQQAYEWLQYDVKHDRSVYIKPYSLVFEELKATQLPSAVLTSWPSHPDHPEIPDSYGFIQPIQGSDFALSPLPMPMVQSPIVQTRCWRAIRRMDTGTAVWVHHFFCLKEAFAWCCSPRHLKTVWKMKKLQEVKDEFKNPNVFAVQVGYAELNRNNTEENFTYIQVVDTLEIGLQPLPPFLPQFSGILVQ